MKTKREPVTTRKKYERFERFEKNEIIKPPIMSLTPNKEKDEEIIVKKRKKKTRTD